MTVKTFPTLDVIGAHSGVMLIEGGFDGIQRVCEHAAGQPLMTHQMGTHGKGGGAIAVLERQHPWLADLQVPRMTSIRTPEMTDTEARVAYISAVNSFAAKVFDDHGATLDVTTDPASQQIHPLDDMPENLPVIVIAT